MSKLDQRARFLAPGDKLGKYDLVRQIAVGGMAEIYLARTVGIEGFEKLVVVKRILPQYAQDQSFVAMFLNEARLAATLQHPNITQVYDIGVDDGDYFFSMEYVHGEDLGHLTRAAIDNGVPVSLDAALTLVAGLCAGLHYAHDRVGADGKPLGIVHRDVSPSNVLVSYDGAVKLVDFGIARAHGAVTTGGLKGKIAYMSPEQCRGKVALDRRSDVFSAGTILYELTTGALPFTDETDYGVLNQIVNLDAPPPSRLVPGYPTALEAIVMRALARNPEARYRSALELQSALEDFAHDNRLRVSPLVLARLMGSLFPARLEDWDHARAQGAFFVEQHVVRTLIESAKSKPESADADEETTAIASGPPIVELAPVMDLADSLGSTTLQGPPPAPPHAMPSHVAPTTLDAVLGYHEPSMPPNVAYAMSMPPSITHPTMGVRVSTTAAPQGAFDPSRVGDVTDLVRVPRRSGTIGLGGRRSRMPVIVLVASIAVAAGLVGFIVLRDDPSNAAAKLDPPAKKTDSPSTTATLAPAPPDDVKVTTDVAPTPTVTPTVTPLGDGPPGDGAGKAGEVAAKTGEVVTQPVSEPKAKATTTTKEPVAKKPPVRAVVRPRPVHKASAKADKDAATDDDWNSDSVFLPVRSDKK